MEEAINKSQRSTDINVGDEIAKKGLDAIEKAEKVASKGRELLEKALENRTRAYSVDANSLFASEFKNLEESLSRAGKHLENNDTNYVLEQNKTLALGYEDLEVRALKSSVAELAKAANVKRLYLVHVDPQRPDDDPVGLDSIRAVFPHTDLAEALIDMLRVQKFVQPFDAVQTAIAAFAN